MKILLFYQHFWPDSPPYANMLRAIGRHLCDEGHTVSVLTGEPSYKKSDRQNMSPSIEVLDGMRVRRLGLLPKARSVELLRLISKALWPLRALLTVLWNAARGNRHDIIVAATIPPVINGASGLLAARLTGAKFVYHLQDIYPEIGSVGGLWSEKSIRHRTLLAIDSYLCRRADRCVVLSRDMLKSLEKRGVDAANVEIINNFMLVDFSAGSEKTKTLPVVFPDTQDRFKVVFAGNLGRFQGLEELLRGFIAYQQDKDDLELHFLGDGAVAKQLKRLANSSKSVYFHGHQPFEHACAFMSECDAGVVSIQPGIYRYAYPSKTLTYLGQGLPVLAVVEQDSALSSEVAHLELGVSVSNLQSENLEIGFAELSAFLRSGANDRKRIKAVTDSLYSRNVAMARWSGLIQSMRGPTR